MNRILVWGFPLLLLATMSGPTEAQDAAASLSLRSLVVPDEVCIEQPVSFATLLEINAMLRKVDADGDQLIAPRELRKQAERLKLKLTPRQSGKLVFDADRNGDLRVDLEELVSTVPACPVGEEPESDGSADGEPTRP